MKYLFSIMIIMMSFNVKAQSKVTKDTLTVFGVCGDCKERIEEACYSVKGVKEAKWNKKTKVLSVAYNNSKTNLTTIAEAVAKIGHDSRLATAKTEIYKGLPACCAYREGAQCTH
jgi:periplasmic mercuric ion binding protein